MNVDDLLPFQKLDAYGLARELAVRVHAASIRDAELRDQATRAAKSAFLNLSEGLPSDSKAMRRKFFSSASGSLCEAIAAVDLAAAIGAADAADAAVVQQLGARLKRVLGGLAR